MKIVTLNIKKFQHDVDKKQVFHYIDLLNADLYVIPEYCLRVINSKIQIYNPKNITDKRYSFTGVISGKYIIDYDCSEYNSVVLSTNHKTFPQILGVHINDSTKIIEPIYDIILGDFNVGIDYNGNTNGMGYNSYITLIENGYIDLWEYALTCNKAYYVDYYGIKHQASSDIFYRTFISQKRDDFILSKIEYQIKLNKIIIDYRTLAFTDHCAIIAEFEA
mgnify:CR=1 FL=1